MTFSSYNTLLVVEAEGIVNITLNRPQVRNAMNLTMVEELADVFKCAIDRVDIRALVLRGAEGHFCAGGDIKDLSDAKKMSATAKDDPLFHLNRAFGRLITQANAAPQVVITLLEGAVLGGGFGLACISDIAIADTNAQFGIPETGLGIPPAQIAPFVVTRVGMTQARRLLLTGARFNGEEACELGVVHFTTSNARDMETLLQEQLEKIKLCAPNANRVTKKLFLKVGLMEHEALLDQAAEDFAAAVRGEEGREGTLAFIEKRPASWAK